MRTDGTPGAGSGSRGMHTSAPGPGMTARQKFEACLELHAGARDKAEEFGKSRSKCILLARRYLAQARRLIREIIKEEGYRAAAGPLARPATFEPPDCRKGENHGR